MKKHMYTVFVLVIAASMILSACGPEGGVAVSKLARVTDPVVAPSDLDELVADNNAFAFQMVQAIKAQDGNQVFSPYSISLALAMAYAGARGDTAGQMAQALHLSLSNDRLHPAFNALDLDLARRPGQAQDVENGQRFEQSIVNSMWGQAGWPFLPEYLDLLASNYGAGMRLADFKNAPESARKQINNWVADQTKRRIQNLIPAGAIDPLTRLVLVNAIYFKAFWQVQFDPDLTHDRTFHLLNGDMVQVPTMSIGHETSLPYAQGEGWQAVALPYKGGLTEMVIIVPDEGSFMEFESALNVDRYDEIISAMETQSVQLSMPKFTFDSQYGLKDVLTGMGMRDAFDPQQADFSGIDGKRDLYISAAIHKAFIAVNEKGTEAAAATALIMAASAMPSGVILDVDRPFFFLIRDVPTGSILFMGKVVDPR